MNVNRIQTLSSQHKLLKEFHSECAKSGVVLSAKDSDFSAVHLDNATTRLVISDVRVSCRKEMNKIEETIIKEAQDG